MNITTGKVEVRRDGLKGEKSVREEAGDGHSGQLG